MLRFALAALAGAVTLCATDLWGQQTAGRPAEVANPGVSAGDPIVTMDTYSAAPGNHSPTCYWPYAQYRAENCYSAYGSSGSRWGWENQFGYHDLALYGWRWDHTTTSRTGYHNCYCGSRFRR